MFALGKILKFGSTPAVILVGAFIFIQILLGQKDNLKNEVDKLRYQIGFQETVKNALEDSIRVLADYEPIPDTFEIIIPVPTPEETKPDTALTDSTHTPYVKFDFREQWESYYRENCAGIIEFKDSTIWDNGKGAIVEGRLYYPFIASDNRNWLLISPAGDWSYSEPPKQKRLGFGIFAGSGVTGKSKFDFMIGIGLNYQVISF